MSIASTSPTVERRQHGAIAPPQIDDRAFRPYFRARDPVEKLCLCGAITPHELQAAVTFRALHERANAGPGGLRAADMEAVRAGKHCGRALPEITGRQLDALARLDQIRKALGWRRFRLLTAVIVDETPWVRLGKRLRVDMRTAKKRIVAALSALAAL